jgi:superfamily II DNA or RNA helicase
MNHEQLPAFATNNTSMSVAAEINKMYRIIRTKLAITPAAAIATAYINPAGFALIADELEQVPRIRLLLGAEPQEDIVRAIASEEEGVVERVATAVAEHDAWMKAERDTMGFERLASRNAQQMVKWLRSENAQAGPRVEVRRFTEGFLHGKAYISDDSTLAAVLAGSSNMTLAGLSRNAELNLGYPAGDPNYVKNVRDWFEELWNASAPYDLAGYYEQQWAAHSPWSVFLRMLWELYGLHLDEEAQPKTTAFNLTRFQADGVARMERLLDELGGVLVADEVGLGKTFLAAEIIHKATEQNRQRVLIIAPAALRNSMWEPFLRKHWFRGVDVMSYEEIRNKVDPNSNGYDEAFVKQSEDYALIVVDEAHNLRNAGTARSEAVDRVILSGKYPKKTVLLTATPVNNSLSDLETLIKYFVRDDARFASLGIPSIRKYIQAARAIDPENLTPEHLFDLMDQVAVRRTRKFVKELYPNEEITGPDGRSMLVRFPQAKVRRIDYDLDQSDIELIDAMIYALELPDFDDPHDLYRKRSADPDRLLLARYVTSAYRTDDDMEGYQLSNAGLLRSAMLKRLESSPHALRSTLGTLIHAHQAFLEGLDKGYVLIGEALRDWGSSESDDLDEFVTKLDDDDRDQAQPVARYRIDDLRADVESDLELLGRLRARTETTIVDGEPKADRLVKELEAIAIASRAVDARGVPSGDRRKVIVFSTYSDTVIALHEDVTAAISEALPGSPLADYRGRIAPPILGAYASTQKRGESGGVDQGGRASTIAGFAPRTAGALDDGGEPLSADEFDILITTDVLAEGVNLQQAAQIINYDLPWNPMRIVQRHGRVDRIGSRHETVELGLFFPADRLDKLLKLEKTLERKLAQAEAAVGAGEVLPGRKGRDVVLADAASPDEIMEQIEELVESRGSSAALSGEEYRRRLYNAFDQDPVAARDAKDLPYGSGSGYENLRLEGNAYVFCVKIAGHAQPWFRLIPVTEEWAPILVDNEPVVQVDTLRALITADPGGARTERWMNDTIYDRAYDAWAVAQGSIHARWQELTDPNNLQPDSPKSFRDAFDLVRAEGGFLDDQRGMLQRLRAVPSKKVERSVRRALNDGRTARERIELALVELNAAGIQAPPPVKPLPSVALGEVRLVAWMAVKGRQIDG